MTLASRLEKLEGRVGNGGIPFSVILLVPLGGQSNNCAALITGGEDFLSTDYPSYEAFKAAVDASHTLTHGKPVNWDNEQMEHRNDV